MQSNSQLRGAVASTGLETRLCTGDSFGSYRMYSVQWLAALLEAAWYATFGRRGTAAGNLEKCRLGKVLRVGLAQINDPMRKKKRKEVKGRVERGGRAG